MLLASSVSPIIQNEQADEQEMTRIRDEQTLKSFVRTKALVPVPANARYYYLKGVPSRFSYSRPWSKRFLEHVGAQYYARFHDRLRVTSLVRTEAFQLQLAGYNGNAAPASGPTQSSHLTGATMDISKALMSPQQREWMRSKLVSLSQSEYLYAIEEHQQPTFHIMVYKSFPKAVPVSLISTIRVSVARKAAPAKVAKVVKTSSRKTVKVRTFRARTAKVGSSAVRTRRVSRRR